MLGQRQAMRVRPGASKREHGHLDKIDDIETRRGAGLGGPGMLFSSRFVGKAGTYEQSA